MNEVAQGTRGGRLAERFRASQRAWHPGPWSREATGLTVVVALLVVAGLVMTFSASFVSAAEDGDPFGVFRRQLVWAALGVPAFVVAASFHHRAWRRVCWLMLGVSLLGLVLVLTPVGVERFGSTRWLGFGPLVVQPSEIAKLALLLWTADVLERKRPRDGHLQRTDHLLIPAVPVFGVMALLVLLQPDLGSTILLALIIAAVLWVEGLTGRIVGTLAVLGTVAVAGLAIAAPYRFDRLRGWLDPEADPLGTGFQLLQSLYAMADGGVFGLGLGASRGKWHLIPNPETDFIFAIVGEELGLVGAGAIVVLFGALLHLGLKVAYQAPDPFGRTVAAAITTWIVGQAFINIATVIGLLPITGVTLPLVSVGGSSLVTTLVALGILTSIARSGAADDVERRRARGATVLSVIDPGPEERP